MINKEAIDYYFSRHLDSWDSIKSVPESDLDLWISNLDPVPDFTLPLYKHQKACFLLGVEIPAFLYFASMGLGKTGLALNLIKYHQKCGKVKHSLVVVPNLVMFASWKNEAKKHAPELNVVPLQGGTLDRFEILENVDEDSVFVVNYQGLAYMASTKGKRKNSKRILDTDMVDQLAQIFDALILDEIHSVKNHTSLSYQVCNRMAYKIPIRYGLTGTPFGRNPHDLWAQFHIIDRGLTLGRSLGIFREAYFKQIKNYWGGYEYKFLKYKEKELSSMIKNRSIRYDVEECALSLPPVVDTIVEVNFSTGALDYYKEILKDLVSTKMDYMEKEAGFMRLRQLSSGFISMEDPNGKKELVEFSENPKLEALLELLDEMPETSKAVVFNEFIFSGDLICNALKDKKIGFSRLWSGTKDPEAELARFNSDPNCRVFVVNSQSGGVGLNLQVANFVIFYESPVSPITRQQAEKRVHRTGQTSTVFMYDLVTAGTVDRRILKHLQEGKSLFEAIINGEETWQ